MKTPNPLSPESMPPADRIAELCEIVARGLVRLKAQQSRQVSDDRGESSLHFPSNQSGHAIPTHGRNA
jgi:hypothetical protein